MGRARMMAVEPTGLGRLFGPALALLVSAVVSAPAAAFEEYQVKAVFLYNFVQFVEWPMEAFSGADSPVVIGVLGEDPFDGDLDALVRDERVNERPVLVRRYRRVEEVQDCHLLFISRSESDRIEQILASLRGRPILTVNDTEGGAQRGVMIRLVLVESKVRIRINLEAARAANLTLSSKLLRPAEIVAGEEG